MSLALALLCAVRGSEAGGQPLTTSDIHLTAPIATWDEAIPLGNGLLGGLLWGRANRINLSLDRGDLWDLRPAAPFGSADYRYGDIIRLVRERKGDSLRVRFDDPYDNIAHPTKIPGGRIVFSLAPSRIARSFALSLARAEASVQLDAGVMRGFFSAIDTVSLFRVPDLDSVAIVRPMSLDKLGYGIATFGADSSRGRVERWMVQPAALGLTYVVAIGSRREAGSTLVAVTIATTRDGVDPVVVARRRLARVLRGGYDASFQSHRAWWQRYWTTSASLSVPDTALQAHLDFVQYLYGAGARNGAPPLPLQGVWTADASSLPPWKGDLHNDLNTQTTYLAAHAAGADEAMRGWLEYNWRLLPAYRRFAREFYAVEGAAIPGVMALDGQPLGGWAQYSLSPTMGLWVAQSFHLHWRYTSDRRFLRERAYPFVAELGRATTALLQRGTDGRLRLPLSTSPEIFDNSLRAWLPSMSNYDLALLHWAYGALDEMATALGDVAAAAQWRATGAQLEPLVVDAATGALPFAAGLPYDASHRHFSHALAIHPLALLSMENARDSVVVQRSLDQLAQFGSDQWVGYSFVWYSAMLARAGRSDEALHHLEAYRRGFILRNGFHANGDQSGTGLSKFTYRPFTLEGNFLALHAAHEMLLQSWGGVVRVFPAVSARWRDVSFRGVRAEGGFRVSAQRVAGRTTRVRVVSSVGGVLRLRDPFDGKSVRWSRRGVRREGRDYVVRLRAGEMLAGCAIACKL
ncbi:MAG: glycoside hydrolase family 95-like protein [Gemmatimonas sp.]